MVMRKAFREIILCLIKQGYMEDVADFYVGKSDINIYDGKIIEIIQKEKE